MKAWALALVMVLFCLPVRADSVDITVNGKTWGPLEPIADNVATALTPIEKRLSLLERYVALGPIYTAMMEGETFPERLVAACHAMYRHKGERCIVGEVGWFHADKKAKLSAKSDVLADVSFSLFGTVVYPSHKFPEQSTLFDLPAGSNVQLNGLKLDGKRWEKKLGFGETVKQICLLHHRAGWEFNRNTARCIQFNHVNLRNAPREGLYVGGPGGPDITQTSWNQCLLHNCGITAEGANIASYNFNVDWTGQEMKVCYTGKYSVPKYDDGSSKPQLTDMWGKPVSLNWVDTPVWKKVTANGFTWGGGPDPTFTSCNASMGRSGDGKDRFVFDLEGGHVTTVGETRVEGLCRVARFRHVPGRSSMQTSRFANTFSNVTVADKHKKRKEIRPDGQVVWVKELINPAPYLIENEGVHNPCPPIEIEGGKYPGGRESLPPQSNDPKKGIVTWDGPRGPEGVIE